MALFDLLTPDGEKLLNEQPQTPWNTYPRPQLRRENWLNLNGMWDFCASREESVPEEYDRKIRVPFAPESQLSGIHTHFPEGSFLFYRRSLALPEGFDRGRVLLQIGAADQITDVYVNGSHIGSHTGGYEAMCFDITAALRKENELVIRVRDDLRSRVLPYGKQVIKRSGMWYTPVSGIWQTVWLECVPVRYIQRLEIRTHSHGAVIDVCDEAMAGTATVQTPQGPVIAVLNRGKAEIVLDNPRLWSPEDPYLYRFVVEAGEDMVSSYFAVRTLSIQNVRGIPRLCLNGEPYFFHGLLDQGYWSDGLFLPARPEGYEQDIFSMKKLGFNMLRKHIKVEPEQFYYDCDRLGMVVFQDMVNNGPYSFLRDTGLPTVGVQVLPDRWMHRDRAARKAFLQSMESTVMQLKNHPCICYWTIFNEGWGQFDSSAAYRRLRELDDTRFIDSTSGWFRGGETDVDSRHVYFRRYRFRRAKKPVVLSEFGGLSCRTEGHLFNPDKAYGYGSCGTLEDFAWALEALYLEQIVPAVKQGLCAAVYTQVSDVEDEINGLLSYDRRVEKADGEKMRAAARKLAHAIKEK